MLVSALSPKRTCLWRNALASGAIEKVREGEAPSLPQLRDEARALPSQIRAHLAATRHYCRSPFFAVATLVVGQASSFNNRRVTLSREWIYGARARRLQVLALETTCPQAVASYGSSRPEKNCRNLLALRQPNKGDITEALPRQDPARLSANRSCYRPPLFPFMALVQRTVESATEGRCDPFSRPRQTH